MKEFSELIQKIDDFVWGPAMLVLMVGTGIILTVRTRFLTWRNLGHAIRSTFSKEARSTKGDGDVSSFSALTTALAATIGTFMSPCEKACGHALGLAGGRWVVLSPEGFGERWHPSRQYERFCAEGRMLFLSLWPAMTREPTKAELYDRCHLMGDIIVFGIVGLFVKGINLGIDFKPGLIEEFKIAKDDLNTFNRVLEKMQKNCIEMFKK